MKKVFLILILALCVFFTSCTQANREICCGYFEDSAVALIYNPQDNTLYEIELPVEQMIAWADENSIESFQETCEGFLNLEGQYYFSSVPYTRKAFWEIVEIVTEKTVESETEFLESFIESLPIFSEGPILAKINKICNTDLTGFFTTLRTNKPEVKVLDSTGFAGEDSEESAQYFRLWLSELFLGE